MLDGLVIESSSDQSLGGEDSVFGVSDGLSFGGRSDKSLAFFGEGDDWGGSSDTFWVLDNFGGLAFHEGDTWVGGSEIDTDDGISFFGGEGFGEAVSEDGSHHVLLIKKIY